MMSGLHQLDLCAPYFDRWATLLQCVAFGVGWV